MWGRCGWRHLAVAILAGLTFCLAPCQSARAGELIEYDTPYYTIRTDMPKDDVREVAVRVTSMHDEYVRIAKPFMTKLPKKMPLNLYCSVKDFIAAGGDPYHGGYFSPKDQALLIRARKSAGDAFLWRTIQHEAFHQFSYPFSRKIPMWASEGLADYFGEGIWTGSGLVTGAISPGRLKATQAEITGKQMLSFQDMTAISHADWNKAVGSPQSRNYNQAWAMVEFLMCANNGAYHDAFVGFLRELAQVDRGPTSASAPAEPKSWQDVFVAQFKKSPEDVQAEYAKWWLSLGPNPTRDIYTRAMVETLTAFLARSYDANQRFRDVREFLTAGANGQVRIKQEFLHWLPSDLLRDSVKEAMKHREWSLQSDSGGQPKLVLAERGGSTFTGTFTLSGQDPPKVEVTVTPADAGR